MIFRQLFDPTSYTYTYLLGCPDSRQTLLIDPVLEQVERDIALIQHADLSLTLTVETHIHADHLTGARKLKMLTGSRIAGPAIEQLECYDIAIEEGKTLEVGKLRLEPLFTPGHTDSHFAFLVNNGTQIMLFSGDALLVDGCGRTDFQSGNPAVLYQSIQQKLFSLPDETLVYPGHDYKGRCVSSIGQEKARNPRLAIGTSQEDFVEIMGRLNLPKPRLMDYAVPGNRSCGQCPPDIPSELKGPCEVADTAQG